MIRNSTILEGDSLELAEDHQSNGDAVSIMGQPISPDIHEETPLMNGKSQSKQRCVTSYGAIHDIESLDSSGKGTMHATRELINNLDERAAKLSRVIFDVKRWDWKAVWRIVAVEPVGFIPAIALGLLLNVLDALSYGMGLCFGISCIKLTNL